MPKKRLDVNWNREFKAEDFKPSLERFRVYLKSIGLRTSTIDMYVFRAGRYLQFAQTDMPSNDNFIQFRDMLQEKILSRSTINNYFFSIKKYHQMIEKPISFAFIRPKNTIPYFFEESDIARIFNSCHNIKHLAMLQTIFYSALRASELCELGEMDLDLKALTIRLRNGKGDKEAIVYIADECAKTLSSI
jgi:integrase/recombinase XerD